MNPTQDGGNKSENGRILPKVGMSEFGLTMGMRTRDEIRALKVLYCI